MHNGALYGDDDMLYLHNEDEDDEGVGVTIPVDRNKPAPQNGGATISEPIPDHELELVLEERMV